MGETTLRNCFIKDIIDEGDRLVIDLKIFATFKTEKEFISRIH